ncbi:uncharacterized protein [Dysidea avara]|uniref:uncharacterized protein isoform X1 n=2 Tax=Dysidea avara TaxID=196820 RepID=UPI00332DD70A
MLFFCLASQMWNFAVYFPLMIGELVPECDEERECFLLLLEILQICVSSVFSADLVEYLAFLIEMYLSSFCECYPHKNILPKQHYLTHFPSQILKLGPLTTSWCMRMEAKNSYFERIAQQGNFKNIALSVARHHQKLMCALLHDNDFFDKAMNKSIAHCESSFSAEPNWTKEPLENFLVAHNLQQTTVTRVDWIRMQGNKYCVDDVIWVGFEDELPKFGKIYGIILMMSHMFFTLNLYITKGTDHHHNSFLVQKSAKCILKQVTEDSVWMGKQHSLETHQLSSCEPGTFHIVTKYFISNLV